MRVWVTPFAVAARLKTARGGILLHCTWQFKDQDQIFVNHTSLTHLTLIWSWDLTHHLQYCQQCFVFLRRNAGTKIPENKKRTCHCNSYQFELCRNNSAKFRGADFNDYPIEICTISCYIHPNSLTVHFLRYPKDIKTANSNFEGM